MIVSTREVLVQQKILQYHPVLMKNLVRKILKMK